MTTVFSHLALSVSDIARSRDFYCSVFDFTAAPTGFVGRGRRLAALMEVDEVSIEGVFLRRDGFFLELLAYASAVRDRPMPLRPDALGYGHLSFVVDDVAATLALVEAHGGQGRPSTVTDLVFGGGGPPTTMAFCLDPDGNRIELIHHGDDDGRAAHISFLGSGALGWPFRVSPEPR